MKLIFILLILSNICFGQSDRDKGLIAFDKKDFKTAVSILTPYAEKGDCVAQFAVGFAYGSDELKNDSLAMRWLLRAAEQKQTKAMGPLGVLYLGSEDKDAHVKAYLWAMLAAEYEPIQKLTTARYVIKGYLSKAEIEQADRLISDYKRKWANTPNCE